MTYYKGISMLLSIILTLVFSGQVVFSANLNELQEQIKEKQSALEKLEKEEKKYNEELSKTQTEKKTLSNEIYRIRNEINGLNFKIKVNEAQIETLGLELKKLNIESQSTEEKIELKKVVLAKSLRSLYDLEKTDTAIGIILTDNELSDKMLGIENVLGFGETIKEDLSELKDLKNRLEEQQEDTRNKKSEKEYTEKNLINRKEITSNLEKEKDVLLVETKNQEKNYQNLLDEISKLREEVESEIILLEETLRAQIDPSMLPMEIPGILGWPADGRLTQGYGETKDAKYFYSRGIYKSPFHNGIDVAAYLSTPIRAAEAGEVVATGNQDRYCYKAAYGKFVVIQHDNNLTTLYAHLSLSSVKVGNIVERGDLIGYMGNSGASTGSHLHFSVYFSPTFRMTSSKYCGPMPAGGPVNPLGYLKR